MTDAPSSHIAPIDPEASPFFLGGFAQDRLTNYCGKLVAHTKYLHGQTVWGLLSMRALRRDLGGLGLATPQNFDWLPEDRLAPISHDEAFDAATRQQTARDEKEDAVYRAAQRTPTAHSHSGKQR